MEIFKLLKSKKAQSQFVFIVLAILLSILLLGSIFVVFSEIEESNEEIAVSNDLDILGERLSSSIISVFIQGKNIEYEGSEKVLVNSSFKISNKNKEFVITTNSTSVVITHEDKTKEIKLHNLDINVEGSIRGKTLLNILYYRNETSDWIELG